MGKGNQKFRGIVGLLFLIAVMSACSNDKPSDSEIERLFMASLSSTEDILKVADFKKTNGYTNESNLYNAEVTYTVEFLKSYNQLKKESRARLKENQKESMMEAFTNKGTLMLLNMMFGRFEAGDTRPMSRVLQFRMTENGWQLIS